jgi:E3 ubiquitin-protein ligase MYCBP2
MAAQAEKSFVFSKLVEPLIGDLGLKSLSEALDRSAQKKESGDKKQPAKKSTGKKKDDKSSQGETKSVTREGDNSLVLHSNPSTFTIFGRMRHLIMQELLVKRFNTRLTKEGGEEGEPEEELEDDEPDKVEISKMVSLGIKGLFELVKETWKKYPELCKKALQAFFDLLQGLDPEELNDEPAEVVDALNELLLSMVNDPTPPDSQMESDIASLACSCLVSLVLTRGEPHRMLATIDAILTGPEKLTEGILQIPENFTAIQHVVQATLLNAVPFVDWFEEGVKSSSQTDQWEIKGVKSDDEGPRSIASDGKYLYVLSSQGLLKLGSGYGGTVKGVVYKSRADYLTEESSGWLGAAAGKLFYYSGMPGEDEIVVINTETLEEEDRKQFESDSLGPQTLIAFGDKLAQILARKDGAFVYREFDTSSSPLSCVRERELDYQQRGIVIHGQSEVLGDKDIKPIINLPGPSIPGGDSGREAAKVKDVKICSSGDHKFTDSLVDHPCRICTICGHCTGYGPTCISTKGIGERIPGNPCGCGSGCAGCLTCGACRVCVSESNIPADHTLKEYYISKTNEGEMKSAYSEGRQRVKLLKQATSKKKGRDRVKVVVEEKSVDIGDGSTEVDEIIVKNTFSMMLSKDGKVQYTGSQVPFGKDGKTEEGEWEAVTLPKEQTVSKVACTSTAAFFLSNEGSVYTSGDNKKGEMGTKTTGKHTLMEHPMLKDNNIKSIAAQGQKMAAVNSEGSLFMFGKVSKKVADSESGVVTSLLGTHVTQVDLGQLHTAVITDAGKVLTFGQNRYGQCGRNYVPIPEEGEQEEEDEDEDEEGEEEEPEPAPQPSPMEKCGGKHKYGKGNCKVCSICGYCTGYGPGCCNTHTGERLPGSDCGCGSGDSGCSECGACQICTGEPLPDKHTLMTYITSTDLDVVAAYEKGRERIKALREEKESAEKAMKVEKVKKKKKGKVVPPPPAPPPPPVPPPVPPVPQIKSAAFNLFGGPPPPPLPPQNKVQLDTQESVSSMGSDTGLKQLFESAGGEVSVSRQQSIEVFDKHIPEELRTDTPGEVPLKDIIAIQVACGQLHTVVLTVEGDVWAFGNNQNGQLGCAQPDVCGSPVKVDLDGPATMIACGDFHTVVLMATGEVVTFGDYKNGQLGRNTDDEEDEEWNSKPDYALKLSEESGEKKATYISADGNRTVLIVSESLLSERTIRKVSSFGDDKVMGIVSSTNNGEVVMINSETGKLQRLKEHQAELLGNAVCLDPEHNVLWSCAADKGSVTCFNPITSCVEDPYGTILSPSLTIPVRKGSKITRCDAALNLLSCLRTLVAGETLDEELLVARLTRSKTSGGKVGWKEVERFKKPGGSWGYDSSSVDAIRFSPSKDVMLAGVGLFGGRTPATYEITLLDAGPQNDPKAKGTSIDSMKQSGVHTAKGEIYRAMFKKPLQLKSKHWYMLTFSRLGGEGDGDSGSGGQATVTGHSGVVFTFDKTSSSTNGTDKNSGQFPTLYYSVGGEKDIPQPEKEEKSGGTEEDYLVPVSKSFSLKVNLDGTNALLHLLDWSWKILLEQKSVSVFEAASTSDAASLSKLKDPSMITFVTVACLDMLRAYITHVYPSIGKTGKSTKDTQDMAQGIYNFYTLIKGMLSNPSALKLSQDEGGDESVKQVMKVGLHTYSSCFHTFYPTAALKWLELCRLLDMVEPVEVVSGSPVPKLLSRVLEILTHSSMSYIGLGYSSNVSLRSATLSSEQDIRYPVLSELMQMKTLDDLGEVNLLGFKIVADKLLRLVSAPIQLSLAGREIAASAESIIDLAGQLLVSRIQELAFWNAFPEAFKLSIVEKKSEIVETPPRFSDSQKIETQTLEQDKLEFMVNKPVTLRGISYYKRKGDSKKIKVSLLEDGKEVTVKKDKSSTKTEIAKYQFMPVALKPNVVYTLIVDMKEGGGSYVVGTGSRTLLTCANQVEFTLLANKEKKIDPENGPITGLLYSIAEASLNPLEMYLSVLESVLSVTKTYMERALSEGVTSGIMDTLNNSFLCSTLLPMSLAQLGPIASQDTKYCIEALNLVKEILPLVSRMNKAMPQMSPDTMPSHGVHVANVETDHPYPTATVLHYEVKFPEDVKWMSLEVDPQSGFAQKWDHMGDLLVPKQVMPDSSSSSQDLPYVSIGRGDIHYKYAAGPLSAADKYPRGVIIIPGNELHIEIQTDTEYDKKDTANHFGLKCQIMGFEWNASYSKSLAIMEKELVTLSGMCCGKLLREGTLPWCETLSVSSEGVSREKADMRIVEAAARKVLGEHSSILNRGLLMDVPTIQDVLNGVYPPVSKNADLDFLFSFIEDKEGTLASRLARWLQPERSVDMNSVDIVITEGQHAVGSDVEVSIVIRDQTGTVVAVPDMQVEVLATYLKPVGGGPTRVLNPYTGVSPPECNHPYTPISQGAIQLSCLTAMMPYSDYSLEEMRLYAPVNEGSFTTVGVSVNEDGSYKGVWTPLNPGEYKLHLKLDGKEAGKEKELTVHPPTVEDEPAPSQDSEEIKVEKVTIKRKKVKHGGFSGLRIRGGPSLKADMVGLMKPGDIVHYIEEVKNSDGGWIKLPKDQVQKYRSGTGSVAEEGYALMYHADNKKEVLLEETDPVEQLKQSGPPASALSWKRQRKGGPGVYVVLQCGSAGHNIRAKPTLKGMPVGCLKLGDTFQVDEEVESEDGIWLKLNKETRQKYCKDASEAWTLALAPSGRLFLHMDDPSKPIAKASSQPSESKPKGGELSAAERLFGAPVKKDEPPAAKPTAVEGFKFTGVPILEFSKQGEMLPFFTGADKEQPKAEEKKTEAPKEETPKEEPAKEDKKDEDKKEGEEEKKKKSPEPTLFTLGTGDPVLPGKGGKGKKKKEAKSPMAPPPAGGVFSPSPHTQSLSVPRVKPKAKALSPAVAECQRAVFAAFLWHEGLVNDAKVSASYLKFNPDIVKELGRDPEEKTAEEDKDTPKLPTTLNYLVTLWDELASKVTDAAATSLRPSVRTEDIVKGLQAEYDSFKKQEEARNQAIKKTTGTPASGSGTTVCELCGDSFSDPVTYHMKKAHQGCRKHASGWGYNSRGGYCSGWAGNCGDGGSGGSTWYLMCKACHEKYLKEKEENLKKLSKEVKQYVVKEKMQPPGKPRELSTAPAVQAMLTHAKFLLSIGSMVELKPPKTLTLKSPDEGPSEGFVRQKSTPSSVSSPGESSVKTSLTMEAPEKPTTPVDSKPGFLRSVSMMPRNDEPKGSLKRQATLEAGSKQSDRPTLVDKPSQALRHLVHTRSVKDPKGVAASYDRIIKFVTSSFDMEGLKVTMRQLMRLSCVKIHSLKFLHWLLSTVSDYTAMHIIMWHFVASLTSDPIELIEQELVKEAEEDKDKKEGKEKGEEPTDIVLCQHPLEGLEGSGMALVALRDEFHRYLRKVSEIIPQLPMGSAAQQMAMKNWFFKYQNVDQQFLVQSSIFSNISLVLANVEEPEAQKKKAEEKACKVLLYQDILIKDNLKCSSNVAMGNSLTDGSTETFWESSGESRGNFKRMDVTWEEEVSPIAVAMHVDNTKDTGQRVETVSWSYGPSSTDFKKVQELKLPLSHSGWKLLYLPSDTKCKFVRVEVKGPSNNVRVRQLKVLAAPAAPNEESIVPVEEAHMQNCESVALQLFRLLTSQVFGVLMAGESKDQEEVDGKVEKQESVEPTTPEPKAMMNLLFTGGNLTGLQKQTGEHLMRSLHSETVRMHKEHQEAIEEFISPPKPSAEEVTKTGTDTYCFELMSMIIGLSGSTAGCNFLANNEGLVKDLFCLLHVGSLRVQLEVVALLRKIYSIIEPEKMAKILEVPGLPPVGYTAILEATSTTKHTPQVAILDTLLACIAKALSLQARAKGMLSNMLKGVVKGAGSAVTIQSLSLAKGVNKEVAFESGVTAKRPWLAAGSMPVEVATEVIKLIRDMIGGKFGKKWEEISNSAIGQAVLHLTKMSEPARLPQPGLFSQTLWLCLGALCVINSDHVKNLSAGETVAQGDGKRSEIPICDNHDDGETRALLRCEQCGNLCGECDRILHLPKKKKAHQRKVFKEEEEAVKVDLHENSGRVKLYWIVALADSKTLKGMVEFRETGTGTGGQCRFCGTSSGTSLLTVGTVCTLEECQERAQTVCEKTLQCGHHCCGVKDEAECLPCLHGCSPPDGVDKEKWSKLKQDADDMCMVCYTEGLSCAPSVQLECGHVFHYHCCRNALTARWSGPRITFRFMFCSLCENVRISHPSLKDVVDPVVELYEDVQRKALLRLEYENLTKCEAITSSTSKYYQKPAEYAMNRYAYYVCYKCGKAYYGGEAVCAEAVSDEYDPKELVCGACSNVAAAQVCPKHGTDFLEYKCRYCCSVAVFFCFGTTHFCTPCHDDFSRLTNMPKAELPQCPVGPRAKPLEGDDCPLHVKHPPTGEEFALGCGVCRNAQTF